MGRELERALAPLDLLGRRVLVACSGGLDSSVLAHALARRPASEGLEVVLGHVHHGLRGGDADADQRAVEALAESLEVPFRSCRISPESLREGRSSRDRPTLQEAARELRYAALRALAGEAGASRIATAHHADDQAETVLLRLLRGSGPDGLAGIPARSPDAAVVRPLLRVPRESLLAYARSEGLAWREDASNRSRRYARNRLRHDWLPGLARAFNPRLLRAIGDLAEAQARDAEWIAERVAVESERRFHVEVLRESPQDGDTERGDTGDGRPQRWLRIDAKDWTTLPAALSRRVAREVLVRAGAGRHASRRHLERIEAFLRNGRSGSRIELPGGLLLERDRQGFRVGPLRGESGAGSDPAARPAS